MLIDMQMRSSSSLVMTVVVVVVVLAFVVLDAAGTFRQICGSVKSRRDGSNGEEAIAK